MITTLEKPQQQTFHELTNELQSFVDATKDADIEGNKEAVIDNVYKLKAKATETIAFLTELQASSRKDSRIEA